MQGLASIVWKLCTRTTNLGTETQNQQPRIREEGEDEKLSQGEVRKVMEVLGVSYDPDEEEIPERIGADELSRLFEEVPSLDEVKQAFEVFDKNKDGFIDATELQRVLCDLGLEEGSQLEECRKMIIAVDVNGDGLIDFSEFVKLLDSYFAKCLCVTAV